MDFESSPVTTTPEGGQQTEQDKEDKTNGAKAKEKNDQLTTCINYLYCVSAVAFVTIFLTLWFFGCKIRDHFGLDMKRCKKH